ncbi:hypothetical protein PsorP6_015406 [Peronosclerospora sorghi]|uniref:Uncharacterized protein n=1 Tax=Peronosclerospora sorghi TaxID=230839 RepID=A0ACC0WQH2_9STRA|nr:hypothetical protein PsorP6_015406 [Peronosclerospora sorghi]
MHSESRGVPHGPVMSRTATNKTTGHAPSTLMLERMQEAATDLVLLATTTQGWRFTNERNGAMLYDMTGRNLPSNVSTARKFGRGAGHSSDYYLVRAVTTVHTDVAAMLDLLHSSTTEEFRLIMKQIFAQYFEQGVTLDKLTCTTPPPFAHDSDATDGARRSFSEDDAYSVNWLTLRGHAKLGKGEQHRDFTLVSYQDVFSRHDSGVIERLGRGTARTRSNTVHYQPQSKLVAVHAFSSVNFQAIPDLAIPDCTDRLHFRNSGFVMEETSEPHVLRLSLLLSLLPTRATLKYARKYQRWLQALASCVGNLANVLKPEVTLHCLSKHTWKQSDHCFLCLKMFRTFRRCHHCRFCGEAVCSACSSMVNMAGYDVTDGTDTTTIPACLPTSPLASQRGDSEFLQHEPLASEDVVDVARGSRGGSTRTFREARGCNACVADLRHGLTTSVIVKTQRHSGSTYSGEHASVFHTEHAVLGRSRLEHSTRNEDEESLGDTSDDSRYDPRLGSIATYIPSDNGVGAIVEETVPYFTSDHGGLQEPYEASPVSSEELQDKFPAAVDEPVPTRFRNTSDPDSFRRTRNGSDPDFPLRLKDKYSLISVSTASSSFSRSSHDRYTNEIVSHYSRGTNVSDGNSAGYDDLSRDPDILALAGLKPLPSHEHHEPGPERAPVSSSSRRQWDDMEPFDDREAPTCFSEPATAVTSNRVPMSWSRHTSADARYYPSANGTRDDLAALASSGLRPADVLRHRSQTTTKTPWNPAATAPYLSVPATRSTTTCSSSQRGRKSSDVDQNLMDAAETTLCVPDERNRNDMIPLPHSTHAAPNFVVFSDARRESIFVRRDDGQDMIPLSF